MDLPEPGRHCDGDATKDLIAALQTSAGELARLQSAVESAAGNRSPAAVPLAAVTLLPPHVATSKILCQVVNYFAHSEEAKIRQPSKPFFFYKPGSSVAGSGDPLLRHQASERLDYECELVAVIGTAGRDIAAERAYDHVAGYMVMNDVSYRDLQFNDGHEDLNASFGRNWTKGKGLDNACVIGPWITLVDECPSPYPRMLRTWLNGRLVQEASTSDALFHVPQLIAEASIGTTLHTGDLIATGTPAGVGLGTGIYLDLGDEVVCEIEGLGQLRNVVRLQGPETSA